LGTIANPYSSLSQVTWNGNTTYYFKRGTTYTTTTGISSANNNIVFTSYGTGVKPKILSNIVTNGLVVLTGMHTMVQNLYLYTNDSTTGDCLKVTDNSITSHCFVDSCYIHGGLEGIAGTAQVFKVTNTEIVGSYGDGAYVANCDTYILKHVYAHNMYVSGTNNGFIDCLHSQGNNYVFVDSIVSDHRFPGKYCLITNYYDSVSITNSTFYGYNLNGAGALYPGGNSVIPTCRYNMDNCNVFGGPYGLQNNSQRLYVHNTLFYGQIDNATFEGGGPQYFNNCTFVNQQNPIRSWNDTTYQIRNCIFYKFIDPYVGHVLSGGVNNNCYWLSTRPQDSTLYYGTPRIYKDPQFIDTTNGNWYTKPGSPATGKGIQPNSPAIQGVGYNYLNKYIIFEKNTRNEKDIIFIARRLDDECIFSERQRSV
jgi:hypothetical protein